jgi:hypothetical protein
MLRGILTTAVMLCGLFVSLNAYPKIKQASGEFLSGTFAGNDFVVMCISLMILVIFIGGMLLSDMLIFAKFDRPDIKRWIAVMCVSFVLVEVAINVYVMGEKSLMTVSPPVLNDASEKLSRIDKDIDRLSKEIKDIHQRNSYKGNTYIVGRERSIIQEKGLQISRLIDEKSRIAQDVEFKNELLLAEFKSKQESAKAIGQWKGAGISVLILVFIFFRSKLTNTKHYYLLGEEGQRIHQEVQSDKFYSLKIKEETVEATDSFTDLLKEAKTYIPKSNEEKKTTGASKQYFREPRKFPQGLEEELFKHWATRSPSQKAIAEAFGLPHSTVNDHYRRIRADFESGKIRYDIDHDPKESEKSDQSDGISTDFELTKDDYHAGGVMEWQNRDRVN